MEENRRRVTSVRQLELLIIFMERHPDLALGRIRSKEARAGTTRLWQQCSEILNPEGSFRNPKEWSKFWNDYKCRVRTKIAAIRREQHATGGGPNVAPELSPLEERVASLFGRDVGPIPGVRMDPDMDVEIQTEEPQGDTLPNPPVESNNSLTLDLSLVPNVSPAQHTERTISIDTPPPEQREEDGVREEPGPSQTRSNVLEPTERNPRRARRPARPRARRQHQTNVAALDEARASIARIEETRARIEEATAMTALKRAEADVSQTEALLSIATSLRMIAESVQTLTLQRNN